jgi:hypothetical protein
MDLASIWAALTGLALGTSCALAQPAGPPQVVIAEVMSSNHATLLDEDGDSADWVELQNQTDETISLNGWHLTVDPVRPRLWTISGLSLPPRGSRVIYCSGKDRQAMPEPGPTPRTPDGVPGLSIWLDASKIDPSDPTIVVSRGGRQYLKRWVSRAVSAHAVEQMHEPSQPEWQARALGSQPAVRFADSVSGLASLPIMGSELAPSQECTLVVVQKYQGPAHASSTVLWQPSWTNRINLHAVWVDGNFYFDFGDPARGGRINFPSPNQFVDNWSVLSVTRHREKRADLCLDGRLYVTQPVRTDLNPSFSAPFQVGTLGFTGWIAEILMFNRALAEEERRTVESYLGGKYGLPVHRREWHTNFKLNSDGGTIELSTPDGQRVDSLTLQPVPVDVSQGRSHDLGTTGLFHRPTPGTANAGVVYKGQVPAPRLSHASGFHAIPFALKLTETAPESVVRFTLDGGDPTVQSPVWPGELWVSPSSRPPDSLMWIPTNPANHVNADGQPSMPAEQRRLFGWRPPEYAGSGPLVVSLRAFRDDHLPSEKVVATYFVGTNSVSLANLAAASLVVEPDDLFDPNRGLYVPGDTYNPTAWSSWWGTGNYFVRGPATERVAQITLFPRGEASQLGQSVGLRLHGGATRAQPMKALTLHARKWLGQGTLRLPHLTGTPVSYEKLVLRNSGQDSVFMPTLLRHALSTALIEDRDAVVARSQPCLLYLNGEYWGVHHLTEDYGAEYFSKWGITSGNLDYIDDGQVESGDDWSYHEMVEFAQSNSLAEPSNYDHIVQLLDPQALAEYLALEVYAGNADWPHNHINCWRVRQPVMDGTPPPGSDGRWRWLLTDLDATFGLSVEATDDTLGRLLDPPGTSRQLDILLRSLLKNSGYRDLFLSRFADRLNHEFAPNTVTATLDRLTAQLRPTIAAHAARWRRPASPEDWERELDVIRDFAMQRPRHLREQLNRRFDLGGEVEIAARVDPPGAGWVQFNSIQVRNEDPGTQWRGRYFRRVPVDMRALPAPGYRFRSWGGLPDGTGATTRLVLSNDLAVVANFEVDPEAINSFRPAPHPVSVRPFVFGSWGADAIAGSSPASLRFLQTAEKDPTLTDWNGTATSWTGSYALTNRSRFVGLGERGLGFVNTGNTQSTAGAGYVGSVVLALDTREVAQAWLSWTSGTLSDSERPHALRLQWRLGDSGPFRDWLRADTGAPWEHRSDSLPPKETAHGPQPFPFEALGHPYVQVRWVYYALPTTGDGVRPMMRLDDVVVTRASTPPDYLVWLDSHGQGTPAWNYETCAPDADVDGDGAANFLEFVSGTNPTRFDSWPDWRMETVDGGVELLWPVRTGLNSVVLGLETSEELKSWNATEWHDAQVHSRAGLAWRLAGRVDQRDVQERSTQRFYRVWARPNP